MAGVRDDEEFDEGDVWDVLQGDDHRQGSSADQLAALVATPPRNNSRASGGGGKDKKKAAAAERVDGAVMSGCRPRKARLSAPVAIPVAAGTGGSSRRGGSEEEDETETLVPPHEWLERKMERMGVASSPPDQACRGRSKARELIKVRDAVLPKTAFSDQ